MPAARQTKIHSYDAPDGTKRYWFRADIGVGPDGKRRQQKRTFGTLKEAQRALRDLQKGVEQGVHVKPDSKVTVRELADRWLAANYPPGSTKPAVRLHQEHALRALLARHGELPAAKLTAEHLVQLRDDLASGALRKVGTPGAPLSARTVNASLIAIHAMLDWAGPTGAAVLPRNVCTPRLVPRIREDKAAARVAVKTRRGAWQTEDAVAFLAHVRDDRESALWTLSMLGMRRGEVLGARWSDLRDGVLSVMNTRTTVDGVTADGSPKSAASVRDLPLPDVAVAALAAFRDRQAVERIALDMRPIAPGDYIAMDETGRPIRPEKYSDDFARHVAAAGLPPVTLHGARHCAASLLGSLGYSLPAVAKFLGQSQLSVTEAYSHAFDADVKAMVARLGDVLGGAPTKIV